MIFYADTITGSIAKTIEVTFPENYQAENLAGKLATFDITAKQLRKAVAAPADDTLAAGDVFHGAFTLALIEREDAVAAMRFAAAAAGVKCTRFGGSATAPTRAEAEALLAQAG